jgi:hypothetical protein
MIAFNLDFLDIFWKIDTTFDVISFIGMFVSFFVHFEVDEEHEEKKLGPTKSEEAMRVLLYEQYKQQFGTVTAETDIPAAVSLISQIQKREFPEATFIPDRCLRLMQTTFEDSIITVNEVMAIFLNWTKSANLLEGYEFIPLPVLLTGGKT